MQDLEKKPVLRSSEIIVYDTVYPLGIPVADYETTPELLRPYNHAYGRYTEHRRRNRGGQGVLAPHFPGGGLERGLPPHFWARRYLKIPPRSLFFHPHNSTVLTSNQSVRRCFEKFHRRQDRWGGPPSVSPVCVCVCVCVVCVCRGVAPHAGSLLGPVFQCPAM